MEYSAFVFVTVLMLIDQPVSTKNDLKIWYDFLNHSKTILQEILIEQRRH